jgi:hypothetical protein
MNKYIILEDDIIYTERKKGNRKTQAKTAPRTGEMSQDNNLKLEVYDD